MIYVFMSLCLMFWASGAIFFDKKTKRQMGGDDIFVFMSLCLMYGGIWAVFLYIFM